MSDQWYWRSRGEIHGPLSTESLEALVVKRRIGPHDQLRLSDSDEWLCANDVYAMFSARTGESTAEAASQILAAVARTGTRSSITSSRSPNCQSGIARLGEWIATPTQFLFEYCVQGFLALGRVSRHPLGVITMGLVIAGFGIRWLTANDPECVSACETISNSWDELQQLQLGGASEKDWEAYRANSLQSINELNYVLTTQLNEPSIYHRAMQSLFGEARSDRLKKEILAAGDDLQTLIVNANREQVHFSEAMTLDAFQAHLSNAEAYLTGGTATPVPPKRRFDNVEPASRGKEATKEIDFTTKLIVFLDVALVVGGAVFWLLRRRNVGRLPS